MSDPSHPTSLTPRQRLIRLGGGLAMLTGAVIFFQVSAAMDPENRAALVSVVMFVVGMGWLGQGIRGRTETTARIVRPLPGKPVDPARIIGGGIAAWAVPGAGHWIVGHKKKAVLYFVTITVTFFVGLALAQGRNFNYERDWVYYFAYVFNGLETLLVWATTQSLELDRPIPYLQLGFLYSAVASLLNLVAIMDYLALCGRIGRAPAASSPGDSAGVSPDILPDVSSEDLLS